MINLKPPKLLKFIYKGMFIVYYIVIYDKQQSQENENEKAKTNTTMDTKARSASGI